MAEPTLTYRLWQRGSEWHWQVKSDVDEVIASGIAESSLAARSDAFRFCLKHQHGHSEHQ